jgi:hypothetical protein
MEIYQEADLTYRLATEADLSGFIQLLADDELGATREQFTWPCLRPTHAFHAITDNTQQEQTVVERGGELVATFQLSFIQYLTHLGGLRADRRCARQDHVPGPGYRNPRVPLCQPARISKGRLCAAIDYRQATPRR